jgi:hypothetical protein
LDSWVLPGQTLFNNYSLIIGTFYYGTLAKFWFDGNFIYTLTYQDNNMSFFKDITISQLQLLVGSLFNLDDCSLISNTQLLTSVVT